jgi:periplasmic protein TonB
MADDKTKSKKPTQQDTKGPNQAAQNDELDLAVADLNTFAEEYDSDNRLFRWALGVAVVLHVGLLLVRLPDLRADFLPKDLDQKVYVVQQVRFKEPPPKQEQVIPQRKKKRVPIPDPTPDEPEPIRIDEEQPVIDLPDTDLVFDIPEAPPMDDGPIIVAGDVVPPVRVHDPPPVYTEMARKARIQGVVIVQAIIDAEGNVTNVKVLKGLPMGLDQAAANAVKSWRFRPATLHGRPVSVYYNLTVNFQIQ